jgi:5-hydroxyisourate hydrolase
MNSNESPHRPKTSGKLSTHVLDISRGRPAAGVEVSLWRQSGAEWTQVTTTITNADGRTDAPLLSGNALTAGIYELRFQVGTYFQKVGIESGSIAFLNEIPIRFGVSDPTASYHIPLLVTPFGYSTYRGS